MQSVDGASASMQLLTANLPIIRNQGQPTIDWDFPLERIFHVLAMDKDLYQSVLTILETAMIARGVSMGECRKKLQDVKHQVIQAAVSNQMNRGAASI